jgi:septal ring factor EnvC (AmiA/AmiB activator)
VNERWTGPTPFHARKHIGDFLLDRFSPGAAEAHGLFSLCGANAEERYDHVKGVQMETLEDAVRSFSEYNSRLADIVDKDQLTLNEIVTADELTYTLEKALERSNDELSELADRLEAVHKASERAEAAATAEEARACLGIAQPVIP